MIRVKGSGGWSRVGISVVPAQVSGYIRAECVPIRGQRARRSV